MMRFKFLMLLFISSAFAEDIPPKPPLGIEVPSSTERNRLNLSSDFFLKEQTVPKLIQLNEISGMTFNEHKRMNVKPVKLILIPFNEKISLNVHQSTTIPFVKYIVALDEDGRLYYFGSKIKSDSADSANPFSDFEFLFNVNGIEVTKQGLLKSQPQKNQRKLAKEGFQLQFSYRKGIKSKLIVPPDFFRKSLHLDLSAGKASKGRNGAKVFAPAVAKKGITTKGANGKSGLSFDEPGAFGENGLAGENAADAGHGANGQDGVDGKNGQDGSNGKDRGEINLKIEEINSVFSKDPLLAVSGKSIYERIIPATQKLFILAKGEDGGNGGHGSNGSAGGRGGQGGNSYGGHGGDGGHGTRGFDGADGFDATVNSPASPGQNGGNGGNGGHGAPGGNGGVAGNGGDGGNGGHGGHGGNGGEGGRGGELTINLEGDKAFIKLVKDNLLVNVPGGSGGLGGNRGLGGIGGKPGFGGKSFGGLGGKPGFGGEEGHGGHGGGGIVWDEFTGFCVCNHHHRYGSRHCHKDHRLWKYTGYCNCTGKHTWGSHGCAQSDRKWSYGKYCSCGPKKHLWKPECKPGHREKVYSKHCHCKKRHKHGSGCPGSRKFREWKYTGFCDCNSKHRIVRGVCSRRFWLTVRMERPAASSGLDGRRGQDGLAGRNGLPGKNGLNGLAGQAGLPGNRGENGKDGPPGTVKILEKEK